MRRAALLLAAAPLLMAQADAPPAAAPGPPPPAQQELIYHGEAASLLGRTVRDPQANVLGRIVDVLVDDGGQPRAAVIDVGGFMGMGTRRIAVAWRALRFSTAVGVGRITLDMTLDQIKDTPDFKRPAGPADPPVTVAAPPARDAGGQPPARDLEPTASPKP